MVRKLLLGLMVVLFATVFVEAKDKTTDKDEHKNRTVELIVQGSQPTYKLTMKYAPGKYRVTIIGNYHCIIDEPNNKQSTEKASLKNVFTVEASAIDDKGIQTLKIYFDEAVVKFKDDKEVHASRNDKTPVEPQAVDSDEDETDEPAQTTGNEEEQFAKSLTKAVHAGPAIVKLDSTGKVMSEENMPQVEDMVCQIKEIYDHIEATHVYPPIGVGGSFCQEDDRNLKGISMFRIRDVMTLDRVETKDGQTIAYITDKATGKNKTAEELENEDDAGQSPPSETTVTGTDKIILNVTTGLLMESTSDGVLEMVMEIPQGQKLNMKMNIHSSTKIEPIK